MRKFSCMDALERMLEFNSHEQLYTQFWNSFPKGIPVQKNRSLECSQKANAKIK